MENKIVNIGQSIHIKGELTGNEDLTIEGKVEGKVFLKDHNLTIGANGKIVAEIQAKTVMILGEVTGNINADDKVEVAATGTMRGDIHSPRVVLADGGKFKGSIDMDSKKAERPVSTSTSTSTSKSESASATPSAARPAMEPVGAGAPVKGANL
jgi:cytoskeletal protein CcmA (bactofilin family)